MSTKASGEIYVCSGGYINQKFEKCMSFDPTISNLEFHIVELNR